MNFNKLLEITDDEFKQLCSSDKEFVLKILNEYQETGTSKTLNDLYKYDYDELPVDVETFLKDPQYLGKGLVDETGRFTVFPYWVNVLKKVFPSPFQPPQYNFLALSGAIGLGKSFEAVLCGLYEMHRMLCLKDPYIYYGLQPIDKISFAFMNITIDASKGVAWDKCQQLLQSSPWFMDRGIIKGTTNPTWNPPKGIELIAGSQSRHILGRAVFFCLDGDTQILTNIGTYKIKNLIDKDIRVFNIDNNGNKILSDICTVKETAQSIEEYQITLEDGTVIKCTPNHKFMLIDGTYKQACELKNLDELFTINTENINIRIKSINKVLLDKPKTYYDVINANPYNNFLIKTNSGEIVSHNCFFDEISFIPTQDVSKQKEKAKSLVNTAAVRMQSRFMKGEHNPTLLVLASSKRTEQSFMEEFIAERKRRESKTTLIIDEPQWIVRTDKDSPNKFKVAIGNKFLSSEVLPLDVTEDIIKNMRDQGYQILDVPMGYYDSFVEDIDVALTDIAGISTSSSNRYFSGPRVAATKTDSYKNAFTREIIEVGNAPDDKVQYWDYFDLSRIPKELKSKPLFVHYDMSISGDKTGLAGTFILGKKPPKEGEPPANDLVFKLGFHVSIKAPKGYQISFEKNRQFVYWLREKGFRVRGTSSDTFQSADFGQAMTAQNYNYKVISVDRVEPSSHICLPYQYLRSAMYESRFIMYENEHLTEEILGLERDNNSGRIDHSTTGINEKDSIDAVCGSVWHASQYADEFAYDYGEIIDTTVEVNSSSSLQTEQEEFNKSMAASLLSRINKNSTKQNNTVIDKDLLDYEVDNLLGSFDDIII